MFDPLTADFNSDCPVSAARNRSAAPLLGAGSWPASMTCWPPPRTQTFLLPAFREPGVVVPEEEQLVNEIPPRPDPSHHQLGHSRPSPSHRAFLP